MLPRKQRSSPIEKKHSSEYDVEYYDLFHIMQIWKHLIKNVRIDILQHFAAHLEAAVL